MVSNLSAPVVRQSWGTEQGQSCKVSRSNNTKNEEQLIYNRKIIQCALSRQDYAAAREAYNKMSDTGKDEPVTRYLMYKAGLRSGDMELGESADHVASAVH